MSENVIILIKKAIEKTIVDPEVDLNNITMDTDLIDDGILVDSLDAMVFIVELSQLAGKDFPEDVMEKGLYNVRNIVSYLSE